MDCVCVGRRKEEEEEEGSTVFIVVMSLVYTSAEVFFVVVWEAASAELNCSTQREKYLMGGTVSPIPS